MLSVSAVAAFSGGVGSVPGVGPVRVPAPAGGGAVTPRPAPQQGGSPSSTGDIAPPRILPRGSLLDVSI